MDVVSVEPRTGITHGPVALESTPVDVDAACERARLAAPTLEALGHLGRAAMLDAMAAALEADADAIVDLADRESALGEPRLSGELRRTCFQLRFFGEVLRDGAYLEASIDHAAETPMGALPDLRRLLTPLGPVAVYGASNFPLAFSVPGGDSASALAAGCPIVVKAHPSHPATSERAAAALLRGAAAAGAPSGTVALLHGMDAGLALVRHPAIRAAAFTGSVRGGRFLFDAASSRSDPIPFYGELGSLNPVVVTPEAAATRRDEIGAGFLASFTLGVGQFCTKPGLLLVPAGPDGDALRAALVSGVRALGPGVLLNGGILDAFMSATASIGDRADVDVWTTEEVPVGPGFSVAPRLAFTSAANLLGSDGAVLREECFGPFSVVATYADTDELLAVLAEVKGSLSGTLQIATGETELPRRLSAALAHRVGRLVVNAFPTGVAVAWSMHHGGPYPSSTAELHTSVGASGIRRFLRPLCFQGTPDALLPAELQDANPLRIPRRVDGILELPA